MKKLILHPKTDTVTICLPKEWVGIPIECKLFSLSMKEKKVKMKIKNKASKR